MKVLLKLTCFLFGLTLLGFGHEPNQIQDPPKYGFYYYLDDISKSLVLLERQTPIINKKNKALGFGGFDVSREIKGAKSTLRFSVGQETTFYLRLLPNYNFAELEGTALLLKAAVKGDKRVLSLTSVRASGKTNGSPFDPASNAIKFKAERYSSETLKITPAETLDPGEYCFNGLGTSDYFCFGIDPAVKL